MLLITCSEVDEQKWFNDTKRNEYPREIHVHEVYYMRITSLSLYFGQNGLVVAWAASSAGLN